MKPLPFSAGRRLTALTRAIDCLALSLFVIFNQPDHTVVTPLDSWGLKMRAGFAYFRGNPQQLIGVQTNQASQEAPKRPRRDRAPKAK